MPHRCNLAVQGLRVQDLHRRAANGQDVPPVGTEPRQGDRGGIRALFPLRSAGSVPELHAPVVSGSHDPAVVRTELGPEYIVLVCQIDGRYSRPGPQSPERGTAHSLVRSAVARQQRPTVMRESQMPDKIGMFEGSFQIAAARRVPDEHA